MINKLLPILAITLLSLAIGTTSCKKNKASKDFEIPDEIINAELEVAQEVVDDMISNLGSPVEMAALIKSMNVPFSKKYISSLDYTDNYNTSFKKALTLGLFGCDLGYLNMYEKTTTSLNYITTIKRLADDIKVGQFFDFETLKRLATNNENIDSLIFISTYSFSKIDNYLRETNRASLSFVMVSGVWLEGLYLAAQVAKETNDKKIIEKIGEQYLLLDKLILILSNYQKDPNIKALINDLKIIDAAYDGVSMTIIPGEPTTVEVDGILMFEQNEQSIVNISDEQLQKIIAAAESIRNKIIEN